VHLTKEKAKENLSALLAKFERELAAHKIREYNEEAAKTAFIQPLLKDVLGWDVNDRDEVSPEEKISRGRVDYGLKIGNKIKIFIEAKPPKADLNRHIEQAIRYGYNRKGVPFVLLTDFEGIKLFDVTVKPDLRNPLKGLKLDLELGQYLIKFDQLWQLSRESVAAGKLDELLRVKPKDRLPVDKAILEDLKRWREILAKDIFKNNPELFHSGDPEKDANYLREITQKILDRIIFMRSCEDRALYHGRSLKEIFEERTDAVGTGTMVFLKKEFESYNIFFDSDLFSPREWEAKLSVDFKVMNEIILDTYNPYQFDVIPLEVLGNIYEQYLGYTIRLTEHQVKYELKPSVRKAGGVYYTPEYIVDYIVKNTVGKMLQELPEKRAKKLRILDPACGSGSFLIRAYEEMLKYYQEQKTKKIKPREGERSLGLPDEKLRLSIYEKKNILIQHIFGVDIDEQAVEVTRLSLMLKMLDGEHGIPAGRGILPMLDKNIKCGNSLISGNALELHKYFGEDWYKVKPFNWEDEFPQIMKEEGGFDVVIGNPPYGYMISKQHLEYFSNRYFFQDYQKDWYLLFLERYSLMLKQNRFLGVIVSNTWLQSVTYQRIRKYLTTSFRWHRILHLPQKAFHATVDTHILIFEKSERGIQDRDIIFIDVKSETGIASFNILPGKFIPKNGNPINIVTSPEKQMLFKKIKSVSIPLSQLCNVFNGVKPFEKGKGTPPQTDEIIMNKPFVKEGNQPDKSWLPLLRGGLIKRYQNMWDKNYWIKYGPWLAAPRDPRIFEAPSKIMVRQTGDSIIATIIKEIIIARNNLHILLLKKAQYKIQYILGLMNSRLMDFSYTFINPEKGETFAEVKKEHVEQLPVYQVNISDPSKKRFHDDIVAFVNVMLNLNNKIQTAKGTGKDQIQHQIDSTDKEIDRLVYELYGLTKEEIKLVEGETK
jgi:type I restriction-modification system DNA methylase subunit